MVEDRIGNPVRQHPGRSRPGPLRHDQRADARLRRLARPPRRPPVAQPPFPSPPAKRGEMPKAEGGRLLRVDQAHTTDMFERTCLTTLYARTNFVLDRTHVQEVKMPNNIARGAQLPLMLRPIPSPSGSSALDSPRQSPMSALRRTDRQPRPTPGLRRLRLRRPTDAPAARPASPIPPPQAPCRLSRVARHDRPPGPNPNLDGSATGKPERASHCRNPLESGEIQTNLDKSEHLRREFAVHGGSFAQFARNFPRPAAHDVRARMPADSAYRWPRTVGGVNGIVLVVIVLGIFNPVLEEGLDQRRRSDVPLPQDPPRRAALGRRDSRHRTGADHRRRRLLNRCAWSSRRRNSKAA